MSDSQELPKFAQDPQAAVDEALKTFENSPIKSRLDELESDPTYCPHKICNTSWAGRTIAVCCETCQISSPSYLCVPCFLNGNHSGHKYYITYVTTASCSCGNPHKINPSGFCSHHHIPSPNPHLDDFGEELSQIPIKIFSEAVQSLTFLAAFDINGLKIVIDFLLSIAKKSDALMRCLEISICENNDLSQFLINSAAFSLSSMKIISNFFFNFFNDDYFSLNLGLALMKSIIPFTKLVINYEIKIAFGNVMPPHHHLFEYLISDYAFLPRQITEFLLSKDCDIIHIILSSILQFQNAIDMNWNYSKLKMIFMQQFFNFFSDIIRQLPKENQNEMLEALLPVFAKWEFSHSFQRVFGSKADDPNKDQKLAFELTNYTMNLFESMSLSVVDNLKNFSSFWFDLNLSALNCQESDSSLMKQICQSTLENASISSIQAFSTIFESIIVNNSNPKNEFFDLLHSIDKTLENFIQVTITMLLRILSFISQSFFGLFVRNDDSTLSVAQCFYFKQSITKNLFPLFCLIQFYAGLYPNKNELLFIIESIFGLFTKLDDNQQENDNLFSIVYFISCLIFDRIAITDDSEEFRRLLIISALQEKPLTVINLNKLLWEQITTVPTYISELGNITTRLKGEEYSLLKLKPNVKWTIIQPWKPPSEIMKMIGDFSQKNEDVLVPFPDWSNEPIDLDLKSFLLTKNMFALEYRSLSDLVSDPLTNKASVHIILNVIIQTHRLFTSEDFDKYASKKSGEYSLDNPIVAKSMSDLIDLIPDHFEVFVKAPIEFMDRPAASFIDLMKSIGSLANPALKELGIEPVVTKSNDSTKEEKKDRVKRLKLSIMADFRNQQSMFNGSKSELIENEECSVCRCAINDSILCYPAIVHKTGIPSFLQTGEFNQTYFVNICTHLIHWNCAKNEMKDGMYRCPIDRSMYNFFIPKIPTGYQVFSEKADSEDDPTLNSSIILFSKAMDIININFASLKSAVHPATIIAGHLVIAEVRYRMWPDTLDKSVFLIFMSNFFLNSWHFIRMLKAAKEENFIEDEIAKINQDSKIESLVLDFLEQPAPFEEKKVALTIKKYADGLSGDDLLVYLRQAAIMQHFCLQIDLSPHAQFIDWEFFLSFQSLCERYNIHQTKEPENDNKNTNENENKNSNENENKNINENDNKSSTENNNSDDYENIENSIKLFSLVHLPKNFLEFALPPYSINLAETSSLTALCLLTNTVVSISKSTGESSYISLGQHLVHLGGTSLLLLLNGPFSTSIAVASNEFSFVVKIISPYINDYGDEDPGYTTGRVLTLSHERLEKAFDIYLSGEWTKFIPKS